MNTVLKLLACAGMALSFSCHAQRAPDTVGVHLGSHHFTAPAPGEDPWVDRNPGVYAIWGGRTADMAVGVYANSIGRTSAYVAAAKDLAHVGPVTVGVMAGAVTGYSTPVTPLLAATFRVSIGSAAARVTLTPRPTPKGSSVAHLSVEWRI